MPKVLRILLPVLVLLGVVGALGGIKASQIRLLIDTGKAAQKAGPPAEVVATTQSQLDTWSATLSAVGNVEAGRGVTLSNDSPGIVTRLHFDSGDEVKTGAVLVELQTSVERAQLKSVEARLDFAKTNLKRTTALVKDGVTTLSELDSAKSSLDSLAADAAALRAQIERKIVRAPFSGTLGIRHINLGEYLAPGSRITTLQSEKEEYVDFSLPQETLSRVRLGLKVRLFVEQAGIELPGVIAAIAPDVDERTRSVRIRASTTDPEQRLRPGMFVNVLVELAEKRDVVTVPVTALVYAAYGDSVFEVEDDAESKTGKSARQQFVKLGETRGDFVEVTKGLQGKETIVSAGAFKLRNGAPVKINNEVALDPKLDPKPANR